MATSQSITVHTNDDRLYEAIGRLKIERVWIGREAKLAVARQCGLVGGSAGQLLRTAGAAVGNSRENRLLCRLIDEKYTHPSGGLRRRAILEQIESARLSAVFWDVELP